MKTLQKGNKKKTKIIWQSCTIKAWHIDLGTECKPANLDT